MEADCGTVWRFAEPQVEILAFSCFEEHDVVCVVEFGQFVQFVELGLGVELGVFSPVREEGCEIIQQMPMPVRSQ
jgi:hypothetical protein